MHIKIKSILIIYIEMKILCIGIMQSQDFINLKTHIINLIISKSNKIQVPQIKQNAIIVSTNL